MRKGPILAAILLAAATAGAWYWVQRNPSVPQAPQGGRRAQMREAMVSVKAEPVRTETVPVYREGIGNVQSLSAVVVRAQVDGRLMSVEFTEGQTVKKGDVLARIDATVYQAQYDQAVAKRAQDLATLANARLDLVRYQRLAQTNAGPKQQADQQAAQVAQLEAQVKSDEAAIANAQAVLGYTVIASPIDGRIGFRRVDPGNLVRQSDADGLVTITQVQPIAVVFTLPQRDLEPVNAALGRGAVPVEVLQADTRTVVATGTLQTIDNQVDVSTGTIKLKATFPNESQQLWPGQFVSARVTVETRRDARVVATPAVRRGPTGTYVYVVMPGDTVAVRPVTVFMQDEARAVIATGLEPGERVVTAGFLQLADGKAVRIADEPVPGKRGKGGAGKAATGGTPQPAAEGGSAATAPTAVPAAEAAPAAPPAGGEKRKRGEGKGGKRRDGAGGAPASDGTTGGAAAGQKP